MVMDDKKHRHYRAELRPSIRQQPADDLCCQNILGEDECIKLCWTFHRMSSNIHVQSVNTALLEY